MIAVDWGSSSLRLYRINEAGNVHDRRRSAQGVFACEGRFREVLGEHIAEWDDEDILMCGMVGSLLTGVFAFGALSATTAAPAGRRSRRGCDMMCILLGEA